MANQNRKFSISSFAIILLALAILAFAGVTLADRYFGQTARAETTPVPTQSPSVESLVVEGRVVPQESAWLSFSLAGRIGEILVSEGESVQAGDVLARLEGTESLEAAVTAAEFELLNAQQALAELERTSPLARGQAWSALTQAEKAAIDARLALETLEKDEFQDQIDTAWEAVVEAQDDQEDAQTEFDKVKDLADDNARRTQAETVLEDADQALSDARRAYDLLVNQRETARAAADQAEAALEDARHEYEAWQNGPDAEKLALAQARLDNAHAALAAAQATRANRELIAPFAGVVTQIRGTLGEQAAPSAPFLRLADLSSLYIETSDLTEIEVVDVEEAASVVVIPDALPDLALDGVVERIGQDYQEQVGDVLYTVRIRLLESDSRLRWGMTVEVRFEK